MYIMEKQAENVDVSNYTPPGYDRDNTGRLVAVGPIYDPERDDMLPERLQDLLPLLPARTANRLRDWMKGQPIPYLEMNIDYMLGELAEHAFNPPLPTSYFSYRGPVDLPKPEPEPDPWGLAAKAVENTANLIKTFISSGVSEENAIALVREETERLRRPVRQTSESSTWIPEHYGSTLLTKR